MKNYLKLPLVAVVSLLGVAQAQAISYDFNTSQADYNANFTGPAAANANYSAGWQSTLGVSNTGSLDNDANARTGYYATSVGQFVNSGDSYFVSVRALINTSVNTNGSNLRVGFSIDPTVNLTGAGFIVATLNTSANDGTNATAMNLGFDSRNNAGGTTVNGNDTSFGVTTDDTWYELKLTLTYNGSNNFTGVAELFSWGADGVTGGALVDSYNTGTVTRSSMVNTNVFGGFQAAQNNQGFRTETIDNFSMTAIPEPSSFAALAGAGVLGLAALRRRRAA